jgi:O-antigen/teichoic acid export membrane protein
MSISLTFKISDIANLILARGSNFLVTLFIFGLISRELSAHDYAEFGYFWSLSLMIGGVSLGGLSSAVITSVLTHRSLGQLSRVLRFVFYIAIIFSIGIIFLSCMFPGYENILMLLLSLTLLGFSIQLQTTVLALLRAAELTSSNFYASLILPFLIPFFYFAIKETRSLPIVFFTLSAAFLLSTIVVLILSYHSMKFLYCKKNVPANVNDFKFIKNLKSFTFVNIFSYAITNIDFTIFKVLSSPLDFQTMAASKIFFDRFILPILFVIAGAISLHVIRKSATSDLIMAKLEVEVHRLIAPIVICATLFIAFLFWIYSNKFLHSANTVPLTMIVYLTLGYILYAFNGILFDVLVVQHSFKKVAIYVSFFVVLAIVLQATAIITFGLSGWCIAWFIFNLLATLALAPQTLKINFRKVI